MSISPSRRSAGDETGAERPDRGVRRRRKRWWEERVEGAWEVEEMVKGGRREGVDVESSGGGWEKGERE
jgi:hypothetical protein